MSIHSGALENTPLSNWLEELHMECYKKYLEDFDTIRPLLDLKESDLKKLGIMNSRDRAAMVGSLANYRAVREDTPTHPHPTSVVLAQDSSSKSLLRKGSLKKLNLKGLLGSGGSKKGKKKNDSIVISEPRFSTSLEEAPPSTPTLVSNPPHPRANTVSGHPQTPVRKPAPFHIPDYEEVPSPIDPKVFNVVTRAAVENEYVPSPNNSPRLDAVRQRSYTIGDVPRTPPAYITAQESFAPDSPMSGVSSSTGGGAGGNGSGQLKHKHLSVISMESGLSFGYDVDKDFNPSLPLENQPWFHGRIPRGEAESLLHEDGDFLVRENVTMLHTYTLSMRWRGVLDHTLISTTEVVNNRCARGSAVKYHFDDGGAFDSIPELIHNHLKYQIPIDKDNMSAITNPVCKMGVGSKLPSAPAPLPAGYTPPTSRPHAATLPSDDLSPTQYDSVTLPRNFGSNRPRRSSPEAQAKASPLQSTRATSFSPNHSPRSTPPCEPPPLKSSSSSGDLLEAKPHEQIRRKAFSPPPSSDMRTRAVTESHAARYGRLSPGQKHRISCFEDYEVMESVSIIKTSPSLARKTTSSVPSSANSSPGMGVGREPVQYAELRSYLQSDRPSSASNGNGKRYSSAVKYAEVKFNRGQNSGGAAPPSSVPHPFSTYDTIPKVKAKSSPYQSRAEVLAQKLQGDYATPSRLQPPGGDQSRMSRVESSPHPFSHYATVQTFPRKSSSPSFRHQTSAGPPPSTPAPVPTATSVQGDSLTVTYAQLRTRSRESTHSGEESGHSSPGLVFSSKVLKGLPGYSALVKLHALLGAHTNEDLAYHLTKADAVCFLITPRVGEDMGVWKDRVRKVTSSSGLYVGLQTLADPDGEKLWKRLYHRHLSISQLVSLSIVSAGDAVERARVLRRFIELASLLQGGTMGNLFSFIAVMQGIASPQVSGMVPVWELLVSHFPDTASKYKELHNIVSTLMEGVSMFSTDQLSVPAVQHLKTVFYYEDPTLPGYAPPIQDRSLLGEYSSLLTGLDGIHTILAHTSQYCYNAWKRLSSRKYDATLMDFFLQDYTRTYLQHMGVSADDTVERRRRFGVLLDALVDRVESLEML